MASYVAEEMMAAREGRSLRDTLSKDLVVVSQSVRASSPFLIGANDQLGPTIMSRHALITADPNQAQYWTNPILCEETWAKL